MAPYYYNFFFINGGSGKAVGTGRIWLDWQPVATPLAIPWSHLNFDFRVNPPFSGSGPVTYFDFSSSTSLSGGNVTIVPGTADNRLPGPVVEISAASPMGPVDAWVRTVIAEHGTAELHMLLAGVANTWSLSMTGVGVPIYQGVLKTPISPLPFLS